MVGVVFIPFHSRFSILGLVYLTTTARLALAMFSQHTFCKSVPNSGTLERDIKIHVLLGWNMYSVFKGLDSKLKYICLKFFTFNRPVISICSINYVIREIIIIIILCIIFDKGISSIVCVLLCLKVLWLWICCSHHDCTHTIDHFCRYFHSLEN